VRGAGSWDAETTRLPRWSKPYWTNDVGCFRISPLFHADKSLTRRLRLQCAR